MSDRKRHRKGKRRRSIRCQLCTPHRWLGNTTRRRPHRDKRQLALR